MPTAKHKEAQREAIMSSRWETNGSSAVTVAGPYDTSQPGGYQGVVGKLVCSTVHPDIADYIARMHNTDLPQRLREQEEIANAADRLADRLAAQVVLGRGGRNGGT